MKTFALILNLILFGPVFGIFLGDLIATHWGWPTPDAFARAWLDGLGTAFLGVSTSLVGLSTLWGGGPVRRTLQNGCLIILAILWAQRFEMLPEFVDEPRTLLVVLAVTAVNWVALFTPGPGCPQVPRAGGRFPKGGICRP